MLVSGRVDPFFKLPDPWEVKAALRKTQVSVPPGSILKTWFQQWIFRKNGNTYFWQGNGFSDRNTPYLYFFSSIPISKVCAIFDVFFTPNWNITNMKHASNRSSSLVETFKQKFLRNTYAGIQALQPFISLCGLPLGRGSWPTLHTTNSSPLKNRPCKSQKGPKSLPKYHFSEPKMLKFPRFQSRNSVEQCHVAAKCASRCCYT